MKKLLLISILFCLATQCPAHALNADNLFFLLRSSDVWWMSIDNEPRGNIAKMKSASPYTDGGVFYNYTTHDISFLVDATTEHINERIEELKKNLPAFDGNWVTAGKVYQLTSVKYKWTILLQEQGRQLQMTLKSLETDPDLAKFPKKKKSDEDLDRKERKEKERWINADTDGDGITNNDDGCETVAGTVANCGCPTPTGAPIAAPENTNGPGSATNEYVHGLIQQLIKEAATYYSSIGTNNGPASLPFFNFKKSFIRDNSSNYAAEKTFWGAYGDVAFDLMVMKIDKTGLVGKATLSEDNYGRMAEWNTRVEGENRYSVRIRLVIQPTKIFTWVYTKHETDTRTSSGSGNAGNTAAVSERYKAYQAKKKTIQQKAEIAARNTSTLINRIKAAGSNACCIVKLYDLTDELKMLKRDYEGLLKDYEKDITEADIDFLKTSVETMQAIMNEVADASSAVYQK